MNEQFFSDFGTRSTCAPIEEEGKTLSLHGQEKAFCCWHQVRQHLIVSTGSTAAMLHGPLCNGALYHPPSTAAKCILHLHEYRNAELHLS